MSYQVGPDDSAVPAWLVGEPADVVAAFEEMPVGLAAMEGPDFRWIAVNASYRAAFDREEFIGVTMREGLPEAQGQYLFELVDGVYASGEPFFATGWRAQFEIGGELQDRYYDFELHPRRRPDGTIRGILLQVIDVTEHTLQSRAAERAVAEAERRYQAARDVVVELQKALLPTGLPVLPQARVAARYLVAGDDQAAGGDWFDAVALPGGNLALVVGDVVGHGVAASAVMGQARAVFDELLGETGDLDHALHRIDRLAARSPGLRAATMCAAVLNPRTGGLRYSTCGHPPPLVVAPDGSSRYLKSSGGGPLGTGSALSVSEDVLRPGDVLMLYSDGLVEQPGSPLNAGMRTLATVAGDAVANRALRGGAPESAAERACQQTIELITRVGYVDDVTALAVQLSAEPVPPWRLDLSATPGAVTKTKGALREWLRQVDPTPHDGHLISLAVTELVANAVEHAYPAGRTGPVRLGADLGVDGVLSLTVADDGTWTEPPATPPDLSGRGLWMVGAVLDDVAIRHADETGRAGGTTVTVRHRLHHPAVLSAEPSATADRRTGVDFSTTLEDGPPRTLRVTGPLDITTVTVFADRLSTAGRGGVHPVVVDLTEVDVLASAGVSALFDARGRYTTHGHPLTIVAAAGGVPAAVLDLVGLNYVSHVPPDKPAG
ncbi:hypothetical protein Aab01nite_37780 [Paractinoplanes abujensis]|uniref:Serine phosphatase RsbU (Regulator of sigma subunit)/anti-sigma regulatory factor (Ser/Thr protein kinase)/anti-anti-sigma regulatory factor n=1 Tax=Paractinoplanes abujensis TaxID=882441 RepID=A0A7W7G383_9ACTN|nr:SpoIIE family protein phosphatase [Actinoplanes abujensis]MBB4694597.1 serine phosphatase RsbU (regulator of sigma subunit)/anti-sigma regulatory factor (Ser/Thr protein kinase)/anti-anti-sigma regulatory factor [Actinoplanes abujensis]GID20188.1 hypothetical protein Aab01nite_37780 [Actinoplanes abujensis]